MSNYKQLEIPFDYEEFRDIENYNGEYQVSNLGRVYSVKSKKFLKPKTTSGGYLQVCLSKNGKHKNYYIHRLTAQAFLKNINNLPQVNHKDENPLNNNLSNLEWCTASYNASYGTKNQRMVQHPNYKATREKCIKASVEKTSKPILQFSKQGEFVAEFPSAHEAERKTKINQAHISDCCRGKKYCKSAGGYVWRYKSVS